MKVKKNLKLLVLFFIISAGLSFYHLIDPNVQFFGVNIDDLILVVSFAWGCYTWINLIHKPNPKFRFWPWMLGIVIMIILSSWQSYNLFGQSLWLGIRAQRNIIIWALLYFPISKSLYYEKYSVINIKNMIRVIGVIELILFISQYLLTDKITFLYANTGARYQDVRYYFQPVLLDLFLILELDNFLKAKGKNKIFSAAIIIAILFEVMIVQKFRLTTVGLLCCIGIAVLLAKRGAKVKLGYMLLGVLGVVVLFNTTMVQDIIQTLFNDSTTSTLDIREQGRILYMDTIANHPILGGGFPHEQCYAAYQAAGFFKNIFLVDNGVFGFAYIYGGIGIVWIVTLWIKQLRYGWKIFKNKANLIHILFPLFFICTGLNEIHWYWQNGFIIFVLFLTMIEKEIVALNVEENIKGV